VEHPHHLYITYLLSRKFTPFEIRAECAAKSLSVPSEKCLAAASEHLGSIPKCWKARVGKSDVAFRRWLRDKKVAKLWTKDSATSDAIDLLYRKSVRRDLEAILLTHGDTTQARTELLLKYPESMVPSVPSLDRYCMFFWDIGSMSTEEIYAHIESRSDSDDYMPAAQGDLIDAYGRLGLQQRITHENFLSTMAEAGYAMAVRLRREQATISPKDAVGLMSAATMGLAASRELEESRRHLEGDGSIRQEASDFMIRVTQRASIPSLDEVRGSVILDANYEETGGTNVRRLTVNSR